MQTVLDALSAPASADDDRTHEQRYHDALQEAMRRLLAAGLLPERSGQPVKAWAHISLADLMLIEGSSALLEEWTGNLRARWAGHRAAAAETGGHQGLWPVGDAAEAIACDAAITPVVVGDVNRARSMTWSGCACSWTSFDSMASRWTLGPGTARTA